MRTLTFDQHEFGSPCSEQCLEISIASRGDYPFPDLDSFVRATSQRGAPVTGKAITLSSHSSFGQIRDYLFRFAGIRVPERCDWPARVLDDEWNDLDLAFESDGSFIRYRWSTSA